VTHTPWLSSGNSRRSGAGPLVSSITKPGTLARTAGRAGHAGQGSATTSSRPAAGDFRPSLSVGRTHSAIHVRGTVLVFLRLPSSLLTDRPTKWKGQTSNRLPGLVISIPYTVARFLLDSCSPRPLSRAFFLSFSRSFLLQSKGSYRDGGCSGLQDSGDDQHKTVDSRNRTTSLRALRLHARKLNIVALVLFALAGKLEPAVKEGRRHAARPSSSIVWGFPGFFSLGLPVLGGLLSTHKPVNQ
jgi:hypothetical protein